MSPHERTLRRLTEGGMCLGSAHKAATAFLWALWMQLGGWITKHLEKAFCWSLVLMGNPQPTPTASALPWSIWEWALLILVVVLHCIAAGFVFREMERDVNPPTTNNFTPHGATGIDPL